ncbi:MAG: LysR family transcriptional regulator [Ectothiorhodospiraceae bacterium]|jgi:DNA-binding transcriptional LysR family regulator
MHLKDVDLNLLAAFEAILTERSITRAADRLGMSQPALSHALNRMRKLLNDPLFVRGARGMAPTPRARQLAVPIREALTLIRNTLSEQWLFDYANAERTFRLAMSDYGDSVVLPALLAHLQQVAPSVRIEVEPTIPGALAGALRAGDLDLAIGSLDFLERDFRSEPLLRERFVCVVRPDHPQVRGALTPRLFASLPHVEVTHSRRIGPPLDELLSAEGLQRTIAAAVPSFLSVPVIVAATDLIGILPWRVAQSFGTVLGLRLLDPPLPLGEAHVGQFWHTGADSDPAHQWLRRSVAEVCRRL